MTIGPKSNALLDDVKRKEEREVEAEVELEQEEGQAQGMGRNVIRGGPGAEGPHPTGKSLLATVSIGSTWYSYLVIRHGDLLINNPIMFPPPPQATKSLSSLPLISPTPLVPAIGPSLTLPTPKKNSTPSESSFVPRFSGPMSSLVPPSNSHVDHSISLLGINQRESR